MNQPLKSAPHEADSRHRRTAPSISGCFHSLTRDKRSRDTETTFKENCFRLRTLQSCRRCPSPPKSWIHIGKSAANLYRLFKCCTSQKQQRRTDKIDDGSGIITGDMHAGDNRKEDRYRNAGLLLGEACSIFKQKRMRRVTMYFKVTVKGR